jgi:hypothetical protein
MRLITRGDLDGLTSAVLITEMEPIDSIELIHPQDITDKKFAVQGKDILVNLPYHPECAKWFDHHLLTASNEKPPENYEGMHQFAPSTARVIWDYYHSPSLDRFAKLVDETDRLDSANLTVEDVTNPQGYILLGYTIDPRTGLGKFQDYFRNLVKALKTSSMEEIMNLPEVQNRVAQMKTEWSEFERLTREHSWMDGNVVITDFRNVDPIPVGNRFLVYTLFPAANVSIRIHWGPDRKTVAAVLGHAIFNRTCKANIGELMSDYGGGGHKGAGSALLKLETAEKDLQEIIRRLKA